jgi:hypothetical protein
MKAPLKMIFAKDLEPGQNISWFAPRVGEPATYFCGEVLENPEEIESSKSGASKVMVMIDAWDINGKSLGIVKSKMYPQQHCILNGQSDKE